MKHQALLSSKDKSKKFKKCRLLQFCLALYALYGPLCSMHLLSWQFHVIYRSSCLFCVLSAEPAVTSSFLPVSVDMILFFGTYLTYFLVIL